jgi:tRNA U34 2-thiouridine synthase MnmA/TrmU
MQERGFDFLFSGEVLGQRPMSQTRNSMRYVEKNSGYAGYILRPLSAKKLPETLPEKNGLVDRDQLLDLSGRGRKPQMALAQRFGITDYPAPAGGCLLTDKGYSRRLKDLFEHRNHPTENDLHLLRYGRHFRLQDGTKLIVGRTRKDNEYLLKYIDPSADALIRVKNYSGPVGLVPKADRRDALMLASSICAGYSKAPNLTPAHVIIQTPEKTETTVVLALPPSDVKRFLI